MKLILQILTLLLFYFNSVICSLVYDPAEDETLRSWWILRLNIYAVIVLLGFLSQKAKENAQHRNWYNFTLYIAIGMVCCDVFDRWFMDIRWVTSIDKLILPVIIIFGVVKNFPRTVKKLAGRTDKNTQEHAGKAQKHAPRVG